ncbi:MAG TPA: hypothetical protein VK432_07765 [Stellaceae bacterium]|nr:hypothetical protein [Stellaceae bacterium]
MKLASLVLTFSISLLAAGVALADSTLTFNTVDGAMEVHIDSRGSVDGFIQRTTSPYRDGTLVGNVKPGGTIEGIWYQEESNHPCTDYREGTRSWGTFQIADPWSPTPWGVWGHCNEVPNRQWNLRRR